MDPKEKMTVATVLVLFVIACILVILMGMFMMVLIRWFIVGLLKLLMTVITLIKKFLIESESFLNWANTFFKLPPKDEEEKQDHKDM